MFRSRRKTLWGPFLTLPKMERAKTTMGVRPKKGFPPIPFSPSRFP